MCWISSKGFTYLYGTQSSVSTCVSVDVYPLLSGENWTWFFRTEWPTFNMPVLSKCSSGGNGPASAPWMILNVISCTFKLWVIFVVVVFFLCYNNTVWISHSFTNNVTYSPTKANKSRMKTLLVELYKQLKWKIIAPPPFLHELSSHVKVQSLLFIWGMWHWKFVVISKYSYNSWWKLSALDSPWRPAVQRTSGVSQTFLLYKCLALCFP